MPTLSDNGPACSVEEESVKKVKKLKNVKKKQVEEEDDVEEESVKKVKKINKMKKKQAEEEDATGGGVGRKQNDLEPIIPQHEAVIPLSTGKADLNPEKNIAVTGVIKVVVVKKKTSGKGKKNEKGDLLDFSAIMDAQDYSVGAWD